MIPVMLDPAKTRILLVGRGATAVRRLAWLEEGGARDFAVHSDRPEAALATAAGDRLVTRLPSRRALAAADIVWIADLDPETSEALARAARDAGTLVNVEDVKPLCDFHNPSVVRRGDLLMTVSTGGKSPGLAARARRLLEGLFGPEWAERLDEVSARRDAWRAEGKSLGEVATLTERHFDDRGWL
ncbi:MAG: NAD(P)-dependent oxidoreductase [Azospirillaceae bacterium]